VQVIAANRMSTLLKWRGRAPAVREEGEEDFASSESDGDLSDDTSKDLNMRRVEKARQMDATTQ
jgi:hypothetical protein